MEIKSKSKCSPSSEKPKFTVYETKTVKAILTRTKDKYILKCNYSGNHTIRDRRTFVTKILHRTVELLIEKKETTAFRACHYPSKGIFITLRNFNFKKLYPNTFLGARMMETRLFNLYPVYCSYYKKSEMDYLVDTFGDYSKTYCVFYSKAFRAHHVNMHCVATTSWEIAEKVLPGLIKLKKKHYAMLVMEQSLLGYSAKVVHKSTIFRMSRYLKSTLNYSGDTIGLKDRTGYHAELESKRIWYKSRSLVSLMKNLLEYFEKGKIGKPSIRAGLKELDILYRDCEWSKGIMNNALVVLDKLYK